MSLSYEYCPGLGKRVRLGLERAGHGSISLLLRLLHDANAGRTVGAHGRCRPPVRPLDLPQRPADALRAHGGRQFHLGHRRHPRRPRRRPGQ